MGISNLTRLAIARGQLSPGTKSQDFPEHGFVEIDLGPKPVDAGRFTVYDDRVRTSTRIIATLALDAPTGKDADELEMDALEIAAGTARTGSFELYLYAADGSYLADTFLVNYTLVNSDDAASTADDMLIDANEL